jgi:hypothetical protein
MLGVIILLISHVELGSLLLDHDFFALSKLIRFYFGALIFRLHHTQIKHSFLHLYFGGTI